MQLLLRVLPPKASTVANFLSVVKSNSTMAILSGPAAPLLRCAPVQALGQLPHVPHAIARDHSEAIPVVAPDRAQPPQSIAHRLAHGLCAAGLAATLALAPAAPAAAAPPALSDARPAVDLARIIPSGRIESLNQQLLSLEQDTGWRIRLLTRYGQDDAPSAAQMRAQWSVDDRTVVMIVDPSSPNIMSFKWGKAVQTLLPRPFFTELQSRFGNMFAVREAGEAAAIDGAVAALDTCLRRPQGCVVVPGLSSDQYGFTLLTSLAGGAVLGSVLRIDPVGFVRRRWVWGVVFFPLWGSLAINFGLGPLVMRTDELTPVIANLAACAATAALIYWYPQAARAAGLRGEAPPPDE